jgi:hypothetical protein
MKVSQIKNGVTYFLDENGCFVIKDYNHSKPFSNFFPGIAGVWGIPMWVFYVNRGQGIASFGIEGKDKAMLEFQPANKAYRLTSLQGFRTFIKVRRGKKVIFWEPFQNKDEKPSFKTEQNFYITSGELTIEEENFTLGLTIRVNYFTVPNEDFPALVRNVTITNTSKNNYQLDMIDGLPVFMPYGMNDWVMKNMCRTVEAWMKVKGVKERMPYFHLNVEVADTPAVKHIHEGNFYVCFEKQSGKLSEMIVEPSCVFGQASDFTIPVQFLKNDRYALPGVQQTSNRTPCAMSFSHLTVAPGKSKELVSVIGHTHSSQALTGIVKRVTAKGYVEKKREENKELIDLIKNYAFTNSSSGAFDLYCGQTFLDNVMRGGLPIALETEQGSVSFNVYSRKHGDPERDYNNFVLSPTYFSQGNGNYRDVNQNRRNDIWFYPAVEENSVINFLSSVQPDGYNPLIVKGMSFTVADHKRLEAILAGTVKGDSTLLLERIKEGFQPGELLKFVVQKDVALKVSPEKFLGQLLSVCHKQELADHGEGFWTDHWTYNLDLIESFLGIYPERLGELLLDKKAFSFYHNTHYVLPRNQRYILTPQGVRQYQSVKHGTRETKPHDKISKLRAKNGQGEIYYTTLICKLLCLVSNKVATLDPSGVGIEMEADKPNWYDALNGLPGLIGSSISETFELKRLALFLLDSFKRLTLTGDDKIAVFEELADFIHALTDVLREDDALQYWNKANDIKEHYRSCVLQGITGQERFMSISDIINFLNWVVERTNKGIQLATDKDGRIPTYFYHEATEYQKLDKKHNEFHYVQPLKFKRHDLPLFLEGFVHALRVEQNEGQARKLYQLLRKSPLFDAKLKMYKVNADLSKETEEIGRTRIFPRGWLENESIWLHMEYKYLLELLRRGLYEEFYESFKDTLIPFLKAEQYGRSPLENSSFLVSSAHEDVSLHGQGFVARLSGSTAEFLHMWLYMNVGKRPFRMENKKLNLVFEPALPNWLFTQEEKKVGKNVFPKNTYTFNFLSHTLVVYHNPKRRHTFGHNKCQIQEIVLTYQDRSKSIKLAGKSIPEPYSREVREGKIQRIDIYLQ